MRLNIVLFDYEVRSYRCSACFRVWQHPFETWRRRYGVRVCWIEEAVGDAFFHVRMLGGVLSRR